MVARQTSTLSTSEAYLAWRVPTAYVGVDLVVDQLAVAVVTVHRDQDAAARIGDPITARGAAEAAEHHRSGHAQTGAGEHRHRQLAAPSAGGRSPGRRCLAARRGPRRSAANSFTRRYSSRYVIAWMSSVSGSGTQIRAARLGVLGASPLRCS